MNKEYKWICFKEIPNPNKKTSKWNCINTTGEQLGEVHWLSRWRQYVFEPDFNALEFNNRCLRDIADFLDQLNKIQRSSR